ncbi:MAG: DUF7305 domain-containing protein [Planctomycetota bacterium]|jgi:hypothetical protein
MKTGKRQSRRGRRGLVLPLALAIALILAILGIGLLQLGLGSRVNAALITAGLSARAAADAGITHALYRMNAALNFDGTINPALWPPDVSGVALREASDTTYSYTINAGTSPVGEPYWEVISIGRVNRGNRQERTVHVLTRRQSYWFGVGVKDKFYLMPGGIFDTFPEGSLFEGSVRTNGIDISPGDIGLYSGTNIPGNVVVGPTDTVEPVVHNPGGGNPGTIDGTLSAAGSELAFPDAELPSAQRILALGGWQPGVLAFAATVDEVTGLPVSRATITTGAYVFNDFPVVQIDGTDWSEVDVIGDVVIHVTGDVTIANGCKLFVGDRTLTQPQSRLGLYLGVSDPTARYSSMVAHNGSSIVTLPRVGDPIPHSVDLMIYGLPSCTTNSKNNPAITLHNSGEFWGVIYAPDAPLSIHNSGTMYGSFISYSIEVDNSGAFYYDSRIPLEQNEGPLFFEIDRWWEEAGPLAGTP